MNYNKPTVSIIYFAKVVAASPIAPWNPEYNRGDISVTKDIVPTVIEDPIRDLEPEPPSGYSYTSL